MVQRRTSTRSDRPRRANHWMTGTFGFDHVSYLLEGKFGLTGRFYAFWFDEGFPTLQPLYRCSDSSPIFFYYRGRETTATRKVAMPLTSKLLGVVGSLTGDGLFFVLEFTDVDPPKIWHVSHKDLNLFEIAFQ